MDTVTQPDISVLIPSFNSATFLPDALDSVVAQTYGNWEAVVMDGGSTDGSREILNGYAKSHPNIRVFFEPDESHYHAIHKALNRSRGRFIYILSASDGYLDREWFTRCMEVMKQDGEVSLVWGIPMDAAEDGSIIGPAYTYSHFLKTGDARGYASGGRAAVAGRILGKARPPTPTNIRALVRKVNKRNVSTVLQMAKGSVDIPQKQDWFHYWRRTGQIFPDGNMCVARQALTASLSLYQPGVKGPGSWMSFFFDFNAKGYLARGIDLPVSFGRFHRMQNTEVVREHDEKDRAEYFKKLRRFNREYKKNPGAFAYVDREGRVIR